MMLRLLSGSRWRPLLILFASLTGMEIALAQTPAADAGGGSLERIRVFGESLEANLEGDDPTRDVIVYLPPGYAENAPRRYPVVYFLHGYSVGAETYVRMTGLPGSADRAIANGAPDMIVVLPDANTVYSGSMYSNSPTTGFWETFVSRDLVTHIDANYRTIADASGRGLAGHSMGGYGTMRIGMKQPGVFAALYAMSSCCLINTISEANGPEAGAEPPEPAEGGGFRNALFAQAAAWAPNPENPPTFVDLPYDYEQGGIRPLVAAKWAANSPVIMVDQYVPDLSGYAAIALDIGDEDTGLSANQELADQLTRLGIEHTFEVYEGTHTNRVSEQFETRVLPFFGEILRGD